jgi:hypothetical protein
MDPVLKAAILAIVDRLQSMEDRQDATNQTLTQVWHALQTNPGLAQALQTHKGLAEAVSREHRASDLRQPYDEIIRRLKEL